MFICDGKEVNKEININVDHIDIILFNFERTRSRLITGAGQSHSVVVYLNRFWSVYIMHRKASRTKEKLKVALIFFSIYGSLVTILSGLAEISNPSLLSDEMASSDMPMTRNTVFSGIGGQTDLNISFTNATGMTHAITMQNSFADSSRIGRLNL